MDTIETLDASSSQQTSSLPLGQDPTIPSTLREQLCTECQSLDFRKSKTAILHASNKILTKYDNSDALSSSPCSLCQLFGASWSLVNHSHGPVTLHARSAARSFATRLSNQEMERFQDRDALLLGLEDDLGRTPRAILFVKDKTVKLSIEGEPIVDVRQVCDHFDASWAKSCLKFCRDYHPKSCLIKPSSMKGLRVIDCQAGVVVDAQPHCQYVALSYVWSQTGMDRTTSTTSSDLHTAPKLIKDSIDVTLALGFQYLWIDRYCINETEKQWQIEQMDVIYSESQLTIIAAAPGNGLPGVNGTPRTSQPYLQLGDFEIISALLDLRQHIRETEWWTRGWTYQEGLLPVRKLIFTRHQLYFQCLRVEKAEAVDINRTFAKPDSANFTFHPPGAFNNFMSHVRHFSERKLTFENDRLRAMQGILNAFSRPSEALLYPKPQFNLLGVPIIGKWDWHTWYHKLRAKDNFLLALRWTLDPHVPSRRLPIHPSWTWAGWTGRIGTSPSTLFYHGDFCPELLSSDVWIGKLTGEIIEFPGYENIDCLLSQHREMYQYLYISAPTAAFEVVKIEYTVLTEGGPIDPNDRVPPGVYPPSWRPPEYNPRSDIKAKYTHEQWDRNQGDGYYAKYTLSSDRAIYFKVLSDSDPGEFIGQIKLCTGIVIAKCQNTDTELGRTLPRTGEHGMELFILLQEDKGKHYERIGAHCITRFWSDGDRFVIRDNGLVLQEWWDRVRGAP